MSDFVGAAKAQTMLRDFNKLRDAIRSHDAEATEAAFEKCERWISCIDPNTRASPKVKPLVWYPSPDDDTDFCADALGMVYVVDCDLDGLCSWGLFRKIGREAYDDSWDIKAAKAAAQADYERRTISALEG